MANASGPCVIVAIPIWQQRVSPVLDSATRLLVVTCRDGREINRREIPLEAMAPAALIQCLAGLHINLLLCAASSSELQRELEKLGIEVWPHLCGNVDQILTALACGQLDTREFHMPGCRCIHCYPPPVKSLRSRLRR